MLDRPHDLDVPPGARAGAVILHPHPDYGGDRHNNVVSAIFGATVDAGMGALRFDFASSDIDEGVRSTGAALALLRERMGDGPLLLAGYSFGGLVAAATADADLQAWFLVAPPLGMAGDDLPPAATDPRPKSVLSPEHDQFCPPTAARGATRSWTNTTLEEIPGGDHFLVGRTDLVAEKWRAFSRAVAAAGR